MRTIYACGKSYRLEFHAGLTHPFQLKKDWQDTMEADAVLAGTIKIVRLDKNKRGRQNQAIAS